MNMKNMAAMALSALLCLATTGAWAQTTYKVSVKEGTEDASNWQGKAGEGEYQALPLEGVAAGMAVSVKYIGTKKVKSVKAVKKAAADPLAVPLTMEALTDGTVVVNNPKSGMQYSLNGGAKTTMSSTTTIDVVAGDKVQFYGNGTNISCYNSLYFDGTTIAGGTAQVKVYGNIMSLIDETGYATLTTLPNQEDQMAAVFGGLFASNANLTDASGLLLPAITLTDYCYFAMFQECTSLTAAPELPATTLANGCYALMFSGCTSLTAAPALPATTLAGMCYTEMFNVCTNLTTAPALPATTLAEQCYNGMFYKCTSLTAAPELPATTLAEGCYSRMFNRCTSLTAAPELPATTLADDCYSEMFYGCTSLTAAPTLPATTLANGCYGSMFSGCTSLTTAPELPATTLAEDCYAHMFNGCTSLTTAPALPVETLAEGCYRSMFENCTSLTTAPALPATTLANGCYRYMFEGCTSLTTAPVLPATTLVAECYYEMFKGCTSLNSITCLATAGINQNTSTYNWVGGVPSTGTFTIASGANWPTGINGIPSGWTLPAATVTTAPTAKTGVKAGQNEAIVNAGTAEGGTMMYMVNATQPASTDGFSATVPTAEGLTAGTYYVWYYVKADDSHTDSEISATGIEVTIAAAGPKAAAEVTAEDKDKLIGTDGKIYTDVAAATAAGTTAIAKIIYIGTTGHATYNHGLALALTDEDQVAWQDAIDACSAKNSDTPVTGATWLLASKAQWDYMMGANGAGSYGALRDGFSGITGADDLESYSSYWSRSSTEDDDSGAWRYDFDQGLWSYGFKTDTDIHVRACLAF